VLTARFLSPTNALGTNRLGPVTAIERGGVAGLLQCVTNGTLPAGTRLVEFTLTMTSQNATNDAAADNLSFVLTPRADPPFRIGNLRFENGAWNVDVASRSNRLYWLEYYDWTNWWPTGLGTSGSGSTMSLSDPSAAAEGRIYRVRSERR
jgi:hypothetical protein